jgi:hypothetical protein
VFDPLLFLIRSQGFVTLVAMQAVYWLIADPGKQFLAEGHAVEREFARGSSPWIRRRKEAPPKVVVVKAGEGFTTDRNTHT